MKPYIKERTLLVAAYIVDSKSTIRSAAKVFNLSKSTVHNDLSKRLKLVDEEMFEEVKEILDENFSQKHIRGGESTKQKYSHMKENKGSFEHVEKKRKNHEREM